MNLQTSIQRELVTGGVRMTKLLDAFRMFLAVVTVIICGIVISASLVIQPTMERITIKK